MEILIAVVLPVELVTGTVDEVEVPEVTVVAGGRKQAVNRGHLKFLRQCSQPPDQYGSQLVSVMLRVCQQTAPGDGRKRNRHQQLRVVLKPGLLVGPGPGPVEYKLAVRVGFQVARDRGDQTVVPGQAEMARFPAGIPTDCTATLQSLQKLVTEHGCVIRNEPVPLRLVNLIQLIVYCESEVRGTNICPLALVL